MLHQAAQNTGKNCRAHPLQSLTGRASKCLVFVVKESQVHLGDTRQCHMAMDLGQQTDLKPPVTGDAEVHGQIPGEGKLTGEGVAERLQIVQKR